jgi:hypothetical protein
VGGPGEPAFTYTFAVPAVLHGGGVPTDLTNGASDVAVAQIELPQGGGSTDEHTGGSAGIVIFDHPIYCRAGTSACAGMRPDGAWSATVVAADGSTRPVQLGAAMRDLIQHTNVYSPVTGVFLPQGDSLQPGDQLVLSYSGKLPGRATEWSDHPLIAHFRYRDFAAQGVPGSWTVLDDDQVEGLDLAPAGQAKYVRTLMPMDVQVGVPFSISVVTTDHYGNPQPVQGTVRLSGAVSAEIALAGEWRKEVPGVTVATPGLFKIVAQLDGARSVYGYAMAQTVAPAVVRVVGDVHSHSGDGSAQRKFVGAFLPGDHKGLFTRTQDALRYMHEVAGFDFGAVSEHSVRNDAYAPPAAVAADATFQTGGACAGVGAPVPTVGNWWPRHQAIVADFARDAGADFVPFPAFEWHAGHTKPGDRSELHRVVLFRDFSPDPAASPLPILPGDIPNIPPQCIVRFLSDVGYTPDKVLVVPHMMVAADTNIDWDLTYADSPVAPRAQTESYYRIGEIYSARAVDQKRAYGVPTLTVFEQGDTAGGRWFYRYGWRAAGAHIGVIANSDNHEQMPGVNDDLDLDGVNYHSNEPGGYAVALATAKDRGAIFDALSARRTYATSGIRAWFDYDIDGAFMGAAITRSAPSATAHVTLAAGMSITTVEVWGAKVGGPPGYELVHTDAPLAETYGTTLELANPVASGASSEEWLYYVRAFFKTAGSPNDADEALWSSPIWVTWSR